MPKLKVAKKISKKTVKKSPLKKVTSNVAPVTHKKRSLLFRLGIAVLLTFLAVSLYQVYAYGTGPLSFLAGKSDINVIAPSISCAEFAGNEAGCKSKGCTWTPGKVAEEVKTFPCEDKECNANKKGCSFKYITKTNANSAGCYFNGSKSSLTRARCIAEGGSWVGGSTSTAKVCTGNYEVVKTTTSQGSCTGNPITYSPPNANSSPTASIKSSPAPTIPPYTGNSVITMPSVCASICSDPRTDRCKACLTVHGSAVCCRTDNSPEAKKAASCDPGSIGVLKMDKVVKGISCGEGLRNCSGVFNEKGPIKGLTSSAFCVDRRMGTGGGNVDPTTSSYDNAASACNTEYPQKKGDFKTIAVESVGSKICENQGDKYLGVTKIGCATMNPFTKKCGLYKNNAKNITCCQDVPTVDEAKNANTAADSLCNDMSHKATMFDAKLNVVGTVSGKDLRDKIGMECRQGAENKSCLSTSNFKGIVVDAVSSVKITYNNNDVKQSCDKVIFGKNNIPEISKEAYCCPITKK